MLESEANRLLVGKKDKKRGKVKIKKQKTFFVKEVRDMYREYMEKMKYE